MRWEKREEMRHAVADRKRAEAEDEVIASKVLKSRLVKTTGLNADPDQFAKKAETSQKKQEMALAYKTAILGGSAALGVSSTQNTVDHEAAAAQFRQEDLLDDIPRNAPVLGMMVKTRNLSLFEAVHGELKKLEREFQIRLPIVHGGTGPVIPDDISHAIIEKKFGKVPIYALLVDTHSDAAKEARKRKIEIKTYKVLPQMVADIRERCATLVWKVQAIARQDELKRNTFSGM